MSESLTRGSVLRLPEHSEPCTLAYRYIYRYEDGSEAFAVLKFQPKAFRPARRVGEPGPGFGYWRRVAGEKLPDIPYALPELLAAARERRTVYLVGGEKDARALLDIGEVATCKRGGERGYPKGFFEYFRGVAKVIHVMDADKTGVAGAREVIKGLAGIADVDIVRAHRSLDVKGADVSDHLAAGFRLDELSPVEPEELGEEEPPAVVLGERPDYPVAALRGPLRDFVEWGLRDGLHAEGLGPAGLAAVATVAGPAELRIGTMVARASIWQCNIGPATSGKSPCLTQAFAALDDIVASEHHAHAELLDSWRDQRDAEGAKNAGPAPARPLKRKTSSSTLEAHMVSMAETGGTLAQVSDELQAFLAGLGQYRNQGAGSYEMAKFRELWTGTPTDYTRRGTSGGERNGIDLYIPRPVIPIYGPLLPEKIALLGSPTLGDTPRWLPSLMPPRKPRMPGGEPQPDSWVNLIRKLDKSRDARTWVLSDEALAIWRAARSRWDAQAENELSDYVSTALGKADAQAARVALVLAESLYPDGEGATLVAITDGMAYEMPGDVMTSAVAIVDYHMDVWRALPDASSGLSVTRVEQAYDEAVLQIIAWFDAHPGKTLTRGDITEGRKFKCRRADQTDRLIAAYEATYPGCVTRETPEHGGPMKVTLRPPQRASNGARGVQVVPDSQVRPHPSDSGSLAQKPSSERRGGSLNLVSDASEAVRYDVVRNGLSGTLAPDSPTSVTASDAPAPSPAAAQDEPQPPRCAWGGAYDPCPAERVSLYQDGNPGGTWYCEKHAAKMGARKAS